MKKELIQKMLDGITSSPSLRDRLIAERCAKIAMDFFGASDTALSMSGVVGCQCKDGTWHEEKVGGLICTMCGVPV
jgi:hypothetical protein